VLYVNFLDCGGDTVTVEHYCDSLTRPWFVTTGLVCCTKELSFCMVMHGATVRMCLWHRNWYVFDHPSFSPDLTPSDFHVTASEALGCEVVYKRHWHVRSSESWLQTVIWYVPCAFRVQCVPRGQNKVLDIGVCVTFQNFSVIQIICFSSCFQKWWLCIGRMDWLEWFTCEAHCAGLSSIPCNCW
jgi:hypothetical protein